MGRSVDYLTGAELVIYFHSDALSGYDDEGNFDVVLANMNWDDFKYNLTSEIKRKLKSYSECEKWDGNEVLIFLENELAEIGISEYCGCYSLSVRAKDNIVYYSYEKDFYGLAKYHVSQIEKTLCQCLKNCGVDLLNRVGTFSNGCGVYEKA